MMKPINVIKINLLILLSTLSHFSHATDLKQQIADCKKISSYAQAGQKAYNAGHYTQARAFFEDQAAWSHSCRVLFQGEQGFSISDSSVATADNNVALTYIKQKDYLKASAWLMIKNHSTT